MVVTGSITVGFSSRSPDGAKRNPGTIDKPQCRPRISLRSIRATKETKERKRKRNAVRRCSVTTAALRAAALPHPHGRDSTPSGVPPRLLPEGLTHPNGSASGQASRDKHPKRRASLRRCRPRLQRAPRAPVLMPAGMMSEPPGNKGDEPLSAGTATRSAGRSDRPASLQESGMSFFSSPRGADSRNSAGRFHLADMLRIFLHCLSDAGRRNLTRCLDSICFSLRRGECGCF